MLIDDVHNFISSKIPISGISQVNETTFVINYNYDATEAQKQLGESLLLQVQLMLAKKEKLNELDQHFDLTTKSGWDSGRGFKLGLATQDVSLLVGLFVLAKEGFADLLIDAVS